jgi:POT family
LGFAIPAVAMALAVLVFLAGKSRYTHTTCKGSPLERFLALSGAAGWEWLCGLFSPGRRRRPSRISEDDDGVRAAFLGALHVVV